MDCTHKRIRCTDNVFYCLDCGAVIPNPYDADKQEGRKETPPEWPQKPVKRKAKAKAD